MQSPIKMRSSTNGIVTKHFFKRRKKIIGLTPSFCFKLFFASIFVIAILPHSSNSQHPPSFYPGHPPPSYNNQNHLPQPPSYIKFKSTTHSTLDSYSKAVDVENSTTISTTEMASTASMESTSRVSLTTPSTTITTDKSSDMTTKSESSENRTESTSTSKPEEEEEDTYNYDYDPYEYDYKTGDTKNDFVELISENTEDNSIGKESGEEGENSESSDDEEEDTYNYDYDPYEYDYGDKEESPRNPKKLSDEIDQRTYDDLVENYTEEDLEDLFLEEFDIDLSSYDEVKEK